MDQGKLLQESSPLEIYGSPQNSFVANFIGKTNMIGGKVRFLDTGGDTPLCTVETEMGSFVCRWLDGVETGADVTLVIRAEDVKPVSPAQSADGNCIEGTVSSVLFLGDVFEYWVASGSHEIRMRTSAGDLSPGDSVRLHFPEQRCLALTQ